jgi:hypothetical protein
MWGIKILKSVVGRFVPDYANLDVSVMKGASPCKSYKVMLTKDSTPHELAERTSQKCCNIFNEIGQENFVMKPSVRLCAIACQGYCLWAGSQITVANSDRAGPHAFGGRVKSDND